MAQRLLNGHTTKLKSLHTTVEGDEERKLAAETEIGVASQGVASQGVVTESHTTSVTKVSKGLDRARDGLSRL